MAIRCLLDTNICIYIAKHNPPAVRARFEQLSVDALAMSVVTLGELQHGAEKSQAWAKALAVWIAAHARAEGWMLVTNNEREFCRVDGLAVENWVTAV